MVVRCTFLDNNIAENSGLNTVIKYMNMQCTVKSICILFPTEWFRMSNYRANQFLNSFAMFSNCRIALFTCCDLVRTYLKIG